MLKQTDILGNKEMDAILAPKHTGMKVSAEGVLGRIKEGWEVNESLRYQCGEMLNHLEELGQRFYAGDIKVVDEFLQLYTLDKYRKNYNRD